MTSYSVYRSNVAGQETLYQAGIVGLSFTDPAATAGTTWYYVITAVNGYGESAWSLEVSATPTATPTPAPTATPTATPTPAPTATPTPTPTPTATPTPTPSASL